jgi:hypothetical protein
VKANTLFSGACEASIVTELSEDWFKSTFLPELAK